MLGFVQKWFAARSNPIGLDFGADCLRMAQVQSERHRHVVEGSCHETLNKLVAELRRCRQYSEETFPAAPIDRLLFVGGEARNRGLCQFIAREMHLPAQIGDPLVRMGRLSDVGFQSGIDRREPQPAWSVAIGLSLGPAAPLKSAEFSDRITQRVHKRTLGRS